MKPVIALTMGDPGGIGPEIILKSLREVQLGKAIYLLIGSAQVFEFASKRLRIPFQFHLISEFKSSWLTGNRVNFLDITENARVLYGKKFKSALPKTFSVGTVSPWNGALSYSAVKTAALQGKKGLIQGLVTAPVHKLAVRLIDSHFSGHTEYLAEVAGVKEYAMMFVSDQLRVTLATIHLPLKKVSRNIHPKQLLAKIVLTHDFLRRVLKMKKPKIGVCALNPHGSEFGNEEEKFILPAVKQALRRGILVRGPLSGDQIFYDAYEGRLDAVMAMYHDQGLAPFKMVSFRGGVNVTLGLPYLRTSPDHGTAFDIAYQNKADHTAFLNSIRLIEKNL